MLRSPSEKGQFFLRTLSWMASDAFPKLQTDGNNYNPTSRLPNVGVTGSALTSDLSEKR